MLDILKSVSKHSIIYGIGDLMAKSLAFFMIPLYTHYLSTAEYGVLEMLDLTTYVAGMIVGLGITQSVVRFYYEYEDKKRKDQVISVALIFIWCMSAVSLPLLIVFSSDISELVLNSSEFSSYFIIMFISMVIGLSNEIPRSVMRIKEQSKLFVIISMCKLAVALTLNILFIAYYEMGVMGVLLSGLISGALTTVFLMFYILRQIRLSWSFDILKAMARYSIPIAWTWFGMFFLNYGDRFLIQRLVGLDAVGIYSLAYKFGMLANVLILSPFLMTWWPKQFEIVKSENAKNTYTHVFTYFFLIMVYCSLGLSILIKDVIFVIADEQYRSAYLYVPPILVAYICYGAYNFIQFGIHLKKKTKYLGLITLAVAALNIGLNLILIPPFEIWGATVATVISFFILMVAIYPISQHFYSIPYQFGRLTKIILTAIAMFYLSTFIDLGAQIYNILVKFLFALIFPMVLYLIRFYTRIELSKMSAIRREFTVELARKFQRS